MAPAFTLRQTPAERRYPAYRSPRHKLAYLSSEGLTQRPPDSPDLAGTDLTLGSPKLSPAAFIASAPLPEPARPAVFRIQLRLLFRLCLCFTEGR